MRKYVVMVWLAFLIMGCKEQKNSIVVSTNEELTDALKNALAGDEIVMKNGVWNDVNIRFTGTGTANAPIVLKGETPGEVIISGKSDLKFGGTHLRVEGLFFKNGFTPSDAVIQFKIKSDNPATHCTVTNCAIIDYNQMQRDRPDHWVEFWGKHNKLEHCYISGKSNQGPTIRVKIKGNQSIRNFHQIVNNHFGPRPRKGGPRGETLQIGDSYSSMSPCNVNVEGNLFERCNGEVEIISSKTNYNTFKNNVFYKCEGSLVTRHGNYCKIDGNYFIGDDDSEFMGGIRVINTGHWVTNNYFYNLKAKEFRSPLAVMNGIPKSPMNRYNQVTDVVVAHNTWVNCKSPWQFGVGSNVSQKDVLPLSEIRSAVPIRTVVANNFIYNTVGDDQPIVEYDDISKITFESNLINNQGLKFKNLDGLSTCDETLAKITDYVYGPTAGDLGKDLYKGYEFETITKDLFGNVRGDQNLIGAISSFNNSDPELLNYNKYGTSWYDPTPKPYKPEVIKVSNGEALVKALKSAKAGDEVLLQPGTYEIDQPLAINKRVSIVADETKDKPVIMYFGVLDSPLFEMNPKGNLTLKHVALKGSGNQMAFACLKQNMSSLYNIQVADAEISNFNYVLKAYKESMSDEISFTDCEITNCKNGIELSEEINDKGDYNVEFLTIENCTFKNVGQNVIDYYRGGYDESTIGGNLLVKNSTFENCGKHEENKVLLNTRGIINVNIVGNTFKNNKVKLVALLWGAKNNAHSENTIKNSGEIRVEENLKLKILY